MSSVQRWSWGSNGSGCLGVGHTDDLYSPSLPSPSSELQPTFTTISCGGCHTLAIDDAGELWSWGENSFSQLFPSAESATATSSASTADNTACVPSPRKVQLVASDSSSSLKRRCVAVSAGWTHSACILTEQSSSGDNSQTTSHLHFWGDNRFRQCLSPSSASQISIREHIVEVKCAWKHSLLRSAEGRVFAFGNNAHGQLGLGDFSERTEPTVVTVASTETSTTNTSADGSSSSSERKPLLASALAVGWKHSLFLSLDKRSVFACGNNAFGQLGITVPASISNSSSSSSVEPKKKSKSIEKNSTPTPVAMPASFSDSTSATIEQIDAGWSHNLLVTSTNELYGFGRSDFGQLSKELKQQFGKRVENPARIHLPTLAESRCSCCKEQASQDTTQHDRIVQIACGSEHSLVLTERDVWVCGWNEHGNLAQNHTQDHSDGGFVPVQQFHRCEDSQTNSGQRIQVDFIATGGAACFVSCTLKARSDDSEE